MSARGDKGDMPDETGTKPSDQVSTITIGKTIQM